MNMKEWEDQVQKIRAENGWTIELECMGIWTITVKDKENGEYITSTGATGIECLPDILKIPFNKPPWK